MNLNSITTQRNILIILIILITFIFYNRDRDKKIEINSYKQNLFTLNDSIKTYKSKNGSLVYEKGALISENNNLKNLNKELYGEVKNLKENPIVIIKEKIEIEYDTIRIKSEKMSEFDTQINDSIFKSYFKWSHDTLYTQDSGNYRSLEGSLQFEYNINSNKSALSSFTINKELIGISIITGLKEKDGLIHIYANSSYPGFEVVEMDGALIDPKKSKTLKGMFPQHKWGLSIYGGYGVSYGKGSNNYKGFIHGYQLGVGVQHRIISW